MQTITLTRTDSEERILQLATALGYTAEIQDGEKEEDVFYGEEKIGTQLVANMIPHPETPLEFVTKYFQKKIDDEIAEKFIEIAKQELRAKQAEEEKALEEQIRASVGETTIK